MTDHRLHDTELLCGVVESTQNQQVSARLRRAFISTSGTGACAATAASSPLRFQDMARGRSPISP
jgi:hypothetical protein